MSLAPERKAVLESRLAALDDALFKLVSGKMTASVGYDGETVTYTKGDEAKIRRLMGEYRSELAGRPKRPSGRRLFTR